VRWYILIEAEIFDGVMVRCGVHVVIRVSVGTGSIDHGVFVRIMSDNRVITTNCRSILEGVHTA